MQKLIILDLPDAEQLEEKITVAGRLFLYIKYLSDEKGNMNNIRIEV